jgi:MoxR-like ATPase
MLEQLVVGWDTIEPVFLVNAALNMPFILLGRHGTCKTTCAREIAGVFGKKSFRFYDATKDDLISIAGIPIPQQLAQGKLEFSRHDRSIWDARVIVVDELTRANQENQNLWLEILEEKSCFGKKLKYEILIATMNPESYAATFKLDEALLDRFYAVLPVPDLQKGTAKDVIKKVITMNLQNKTLCRDAIRKLIAKIQTTYAALGQDSTVRNAVSEYVAQFMEILLTRTETYISPRKTIHLVEEILGLAAYFSLQGQPDFLVKAAENALTYVLVIPLTIKPEVLMQIHGTLKTMFLDKTIDLADTIRIDLAKFTSNGQYIKYLRKNIERIERNLPYDETDKLLAEVVAHAETQDLPLLRDLLEKINGHEEQKRIIRGRILFHEMEIVNKIQLHLTNYHLHNENDFVTFSRARQFMQRLKKLPFDRDIENLVFTQEENFSRLVRHVRKRGVHAGTRKTGKGVPGPGFESARDSTVRKSE